MKKNRIEYLDSIRGIAAMMVVVYHFIGWRWSDKNSVHALSTIFNGSDAVSFFFVLSGFVLSFQYFHSTRELKFKDYIIKRFLRLYPAYFFTVILNYFYWNRHTLGIDTLKDIFYSNSQQLWQELLLVRADHKFYIPGWTLGVEMALSLLLPFLILIAKQNIKYIYYFIPIVVYIGAGQISMFTLHFCLGLLLAFHLPQIKSFSFKESAIYPYRFVILFSTWILFSLRHLDKIKPISHYIMKVLSFWGIDIFHLTGLASFIILLYTLNNIKFQRFLNWSPLAYIGKISYSIYLMHWLVVVYIMDHWEKWQNYFHSEKITFMTMLLVTILVTIFLSQICYSIFEAPFIKLGKKLQSLRKNQSF